MTGVLAGARRQRIPRWWPIALGLVFAGAVVVGRAASGHGVVSTDPLGAFLIAVAAILLTCHVFGSLALRCRQPAVIGEVLGGIVLGPSLLGGVWPAAFNWLFPPTVRVALSMAAQLGLVVFVFFMGCELSRDGGLSRPRAVGATIVGAMGLPLLVGFGIAVVLPERLQGSSTNWPMFAAFFSLAISTTALPVFSPRRGRSRPESHIVRSAVPGYRSDR